MESQREEDQISGYKKLSKTIIKCLAPDAHDTAYLQVEASSITTDEYTFHYQIHSGVIFLTLADKSFPRLLAFSYLNELVKAFFDDLSSSSSLGQRSVQAVQRPYSFIRFEPVIQGIKKRYANTRQLRTQEDLVELSGRIQSIPIYSARDVLGVSGPIVGIPPLTPLAHLPPSPPPSSTRQWVCLCIFAMDILYLLLWWTSWVGGGRPLTDGLGRVEGPRWVERGLVLVIGVSSPVLLVQAYKHHTNIRTQSHLVANVSTLHALTTLVQILVVSFCKRNVVPRNTSAPLQAAAGWFAGWCLPVPVVAIKVVYVLLVTREVGQTVTRWVRRWRDTKRGHRD
ncbi:hypothetical protein SpCBS45565_g00222 [Spizellomyces sp. 'palustris']|nr:hypothetical protein SpCBS45565_g00222 [Spizellomyces sp. 'palustris']